MRNPFPLRFMADPHPPFPSTGWLGLLHTFFVSAVVFFGSGWLLPSCSFPSAWAAAQARLLAGSGSALGWLLRLGSWLLAQARLLNAAQAGFLAGAQAGLLTGLLAGFLSCFSATPQAGGYGQPTVEKERGGGLIVIPDPFHWGGVRRVYLGYFG